MLRKIAFMMEVDSYNTQKAIKRAYRLVEEGADIIDVGGESARPGASAIPQEQEVSRDTTSNQGAYVKII